MVIQADDRLGFTSHGVPVTAVCVGRGVVVVLASE